MEVNQMYKAKKEALLALLHSFAHYQPFITEALLEEEIEKASLQINPEETMDISLSLIFIVQNRMYAILCEAIRNENVDIEIQLLEDCQKWIRIMCKKSRPPKIYNLQKSESFLEDVFQEYQGETDFQKFVTTTFKEQYEHPKTLHLKKPL